MFASIRTPLTNGEDQRGACGVLEWAMEWCFFLVDCMCVFWTTHQAIANLLTQVVAVERIIHVGILSVCLCLSLKSRLTSSIHKRTGRTKGKRDSRPFNSTTFNSNICSSVFIFKLKISTPYSQAFFLGRSLPHFSPRSSQFFFFLCVCLGLQTEQCATIRSNTFSAFFFARPLLNNIFKTNTFRARIICPRRVSFAFKGEGTENKNR